VVGSRTRSSLLLTWALGLPGALLIAATTVMLLGLPLGADPLWAVEPMTLSEAAALRDNGEVVRLIESGEDVNGTSVVRPNVFSERELVMTPIEAAVAGAENVAWLNVHDVVL
jgi:quinol-cytochrome oxidoreductase complex cytochrome b subunit